MIFIKESEAPLEVIGPPYKRIIRHLSAPWTTGSKNVWIGTSSVDPGYTSNEHFHDGQEEIFYCVSGKGKVKIDSEIADMEPGDLVYVPPGCKHQLINDGNLVFKVLAVVAPPFIPEKFKQDHGL